MRKKGQPITVVEPLMAFDDEEEPRRVRKPKYDDEEEPRRVRKPDPYANYKKRYLKQQVDDSNGDGRIKKRVVDEEESDEGKNDRGRHVKKFPGTPPARSPKFPPPIESPVPEPKKKSPEEKKRSPFASPPKSGDTKAERPASALKPIREEKDAEITPRQKLEKTREKMVRPTTAEETRKSKQAEEAERAWREKARQKVLMSAQKRHPSVSNRETINPKAERPPFQPRSLSPAKAERPAFVPKSIPEEKDAGITQVQKAERPVRETRAMKEAREANEALAEKAKLAENAWRESARRKVVMSAQKRQEGVSSGKTFNPKTERPAFRPRSFSPNKPSRQPEIQSQNAGNTTGWSRHGSPSSGKQIDGSAQRPVFQPKRSPSTEHASSSPQRPVFQPKRSSRIERPSQEHTPSVSKEKSEIPRKANDSMTSKSGSEYAPFNEMQDVDSITTPPIQEEAIWSSPRHLRSEKEKPPADKRDRKRSHKKKSSIIDADDQSIWGSFPEPETPPPLIAISSESQSTRIILDPIDNRITFKEKASTEKKGKDFEWNSKPDIKGKKISDPKGKSQAQAWPVIADAPVEVTHTVTESVEDGKLDERKRTRRRRTGENTEGSRDRRTSKDPKDSVRKTSETVTREESQRSVTREENERSATREESERSAAPVTVAQDTIESQRIVAPVAPALVHSILANVEEIPWTDSPEQKPYKMKTFLPNPEVVTQINYNNAIQYHHAIEDVRYAPKFRVDEHEHLSLALAWRIPDEDQMHTLKSPFSDKMSSSSPVAPAIEDERVGVLYTATTTLTKVHELSFDAKTEREKHMMRSEIALQEVLMMLQKGRSDSARDDLAHINKLLEKIAAEKRVTHPIVDHSFEVNRLRELSQPPAPEIRVIGVPSPVPSHHPSPATTHPSPALPVHPFPSSPEIPPPTAVSRPNYTLFSDKQWDKLSASYDRLASRSGKAGLDATAIMPLLVKSKLDQDTLLQVLTLCDEDQDGKFTKIEFAMAIVMARMMAAPGAQLPAYIPPELKASLEERCRAVK